MYYCSTRKFEKTFEKLVGKFQYFCCTVVFPKILAMRIRACENKCSIVALDRVDRAMMILITQGGRGSESRHGQNLITCTFANS